MTPFTIRIVAILAVSLTCVTSRASAGQADGKPGPDSSVRQQPNTLPGGTSAIEVVNTQPVDIDPTSCRGESVMQISNPSDSPVNVRLHGAPGDGASGAWSITFALAGTTGDGKTSFEASLPPRSVVPIRVLVQDVTADGDQSVDVFNMGTKFAKIAVRRSPVGLALDTVVSAQNPLRAVQWREDSAGLEESGSDRLLVPLGGARGRPGLVLGGHRVGHGPALRPRRARMRARDRLFP